MKVYALVLLLYTLRSGMPSFSQAKIEGIGRFTIGKATVSLVQEIATETGIPVEIVDSNIKMEKLAKSQIVEIKSKTALLCTHVRVFYMNNYKEADIELKSVYLFFEDNVLVKFTCYASSQLNSALESKYGEPEVEIIKLYSDCNLDAKSFVITWTNGSIAAILSLLVSYDDNCQKRVNQEFSIALQGKENQIAPCEGIVKTRGK